MCCMYIIIHFSESSKLLKMAGMITTKLSSSCSITS